MAMHRTHEPTGAPDEQAIRDLTAALASDESIVVETVRTMLETVPGYDDVPTESIRASVLRNINVSVRTILDGRVPEADQVDEAEALATERLAQDVPLGSVLAGYRVSMSVILRHLLDLSPRFGIPASDVLAFSTLLWGLADSFSARALQVFQQHDITQAVEDSARRAQWVNDALVGSLPRTELHQGAVMLGIPVDATVRAMSIGLGPNGSGDLTGAVAWADRHGHRLLIVPQGTGAVGIMIGDPDPIDAPQDLVIARGPAGTLEQLPESLTITTRVLAVARRVRFTGLVDRSRLSWRMGILSSPDITERLHDQLIAPVLAEGAFGEIILEALKAYLEHGLNIPRAAATIPVHVNTLRYRLHRFEDLVEVSLQDLDTLFELSWALAADSGEQPEQPTASAD